MSRRLLQFFLFLFFSTIGAVALVRWMIPEPISTEVTHEERLVGAGLYRSLGEIYLDSLKSNPHSLVYHQKMQILYPSLTTDLKGKVDNFYDSIATYLDLENEYLYSIGFRYSKGGYHDSAAFYYAQIEGADTMSHLHHTRAYTHMKLRDYNTAEVYFQKAIAEENSLGAAYKNLAKLYQQTGQYKKLDSLIGVDEAQSYIPLSIKRGSYVRKGNYKAYWDSFIAVNFTGFIWEGIVASALIALVWIGFLSHISLFKRTSAVKSLGFVLLGALFSTFCTVLYDFYDIGLGVEITGDHLKDLTFCILGIGFIEELLKIVPILVLLWFLRKRNIEPVSLLIMASLSAVGFAFMENLGYFDLYGLKSIFGRSLTASVLHMGLTALPVYGIIRARQKGSSVVMGLTLWFSLAVVIHGFYDFFLFADKGMREFRLVSILIWGVLLFLYRNMIQNALNISPLFNRRREGYLRKTGYYLGYALYMVFLLQFVFLAKRFGSRESIAGLPSSIAFYSYLLLLIPVIFASMRLYKGYFPPLFIWGKRARAPRALPAVVREEMHSQWHIFKNEHHGECFKSQPYASQGDRYYSLLVWISGGIAVLVTLFSVQFGLMPALFVALFSLAVIHMMRTFHKSSLWVLWVDLTKERLILYFRGKRHERIAFADIVAMHHHGSYRELILPTRRVMLDRTLFRNFEISTFFLYFDSYLITREVEIEEFAVSLPPEEIEEFALFQPDDELVEFVLPSLSCVESLEVNKKDSS